MDKLINIPAAVQIIELSNVLIPVMKKNEVIKLMSIYGDVLERLAKEAEGKENAR